MNIHECLRLKNKRFVLIEPIKIQVMPISQSFFTVFIYTPPKSKLYYPDNNVDSLNLVGLFLIFYAPAKKKKNICTSFSQPPRCVSEQNKNKHVLRQQTDTYDWIKKDIW